MKMRRIAAALLAAVLALAGAAFAETAVPTIETEVVEIQKYGNLVLGVSAKSLMDQGYEYGDLISVTLNGETLEMPFCHDYTDVDNKELVCRAVTDGSKDDNKVILAINLGDLATDRGIAVKSVITEDPGFRWDYSVPTPVKVTLSMKEKGGYKDEYTLHQLPHSNNREDYPNLTDEQYANFRNVRTTGMGAGTLYRSSSPIDPELNRNKEADEALNNAGVRTILNLEDTEQAMKDYEGYALTHYSRRDIIPLNMPLDPTSDEFSAGMAKGIAFLASHEGPYLVHCREGKNRAGFVCAVLECLMGASAEEVVADYMVTFYNYYGVEPGTEKYDALAKQGVIKNLRAVFGVDDIYSVNLAESAEKYLLSIGVEQKVIDQLKANLGKPCE